MEVIRPNERYFDEYLRACKESYENNIDEWKPFEPEYYEQWKACILDVYKNYEEGVDIPEGMPRTYTYWCVEDQVFIGEIQIRPFITEAQAQIWGHIAYAIRYSKWNQGYGTLLLNKALEKAKEFQIEDVYIVCRDSNIGSKRVIEKNKGQLINQIQDAEGAIENVYRVCESE